MQPSLPASEQPYLLPLATELFDLAEASFPAVDGLRCVQVRTNRYSVPLRPGTKVEARVNADSVELWHEGRRVARRERCFSRQQQVLDLEHYPDVLERKPGALSGSTALAQWRQAGRWPESFDRLWQALNMRHGWERGTRQIIELLQLGTGEGGAGCGPQSSRPCRSVVATLHGLIDARAVLRASATLQPEAPRISIPLSCPRYLPQVWQVYPRHAALSDPRCRADLGVAIGSHECEMATLRPGGTYHWWRESRTESPFVRFAHFSLPIVIRVVYKVYP